MKLILINGLPGTGKTTLLEALSKELRLPVVAKDQIKELLLDTLGHEDREWSKRLGRISIEFLYTLSREMIAANSTFIVEGAFEYEFAKPAFEAMLSGHQIDVVELYCRTDATIRRERFKARNESGKRHPGHMDHVNYMADDEPEPLEKYRPLEIGRVVYIDTDTAYNIDAIIKELAL